MCEFTLVASGSKWRLKSGPVNLPTVQSAGYAGDTSSAGIFKCFYGVSGEKLMSRVAVFAGLVVDESDNPVDVVDVGSIPHYVVDDDGFLRHILAEQVDRQVLSVMQDNVMENREAIVAGMLE